MIDDREQTVREFYDDPRRRELLKRIDVMKVKLLVWLKDPKATRNDPVFVEYEQLMRDLLALDPGVESTH